MGAALDRLAGRLEVVREVGGQVMARCPAHEDRTPSLALRPIEGSVLVHDHGGCATADVLAAVGLGMADLFDDPRGVTYHYDNGRTVHRTPDKRFRQAHTENPPELYRLARVRDAVAEGRPIFIVEGEKDCAAAESAGLTATCCPMGAGKWSKVDPSPLYGGRVLVVADRDEPGRKHAAEIVVSLRGHVESVALFEAAAGKDLADHLAAGYGVEELLPVELPTAPQEKRGDDASPDDGRKSAATVLVDLARARYTFGVSEEGEPFAVPVAGEPVVRLLRGGKKGLRAELARGYFEAHGKAAPQQALADALLVIEGLAEGGEPEPLAQRVAEHGGAWWVDLGDNTGEAVRVDGTGWTITRPPLRFRRTVLTGALPRPEPGGDLGELWELLNVAEADRPLLLAWLITALIAGVPHPILSLAGEQGTGKSSAARMVVSLVDPSPVPLRTAPRDVDSWITAAGGSWVVCLDNVSTVPDWLSDALCRAVTGDGAVRRQLYTDAGLALFAFRRVVALTGIDLGAVRGDLADRLLVIDLDVIDDADRMLDADLERRWAQVRPRVLGALYAGVAGVAGVLPSVRLDRSPRMADFARVLAAVDQLQGTDGLDRYLARGRNLAADALTADPFVVEMARQLSEEFIGTASDLLAVIVADADSRTPKGWPANARQLTTLLKRQAPVMRRAGWAVRETVDPHAKVLRWTVRPPEKACSGYPQTPQPPQHAGTTAGDNPAGPAATPARHPHESPRSPHVAGVAGLAGDEYGPSQDDDSGAGHGSDYRTDEQREQDRRAAVVFGRRSA